VKLAFFNELHLSLQTNFAALWCLRFSASDSYVERVRPTLALHIFVFLTVSSTWEPVYEFIVPRFRPKTTTFRLPYQRHSSSADCAKKHFKPSKDSARF